jgi:adenine-specific DNA-methyltransferase
MGPTLLETAAEIISEALLTHQQRFNLAIRNPPYFKINSQSRTRKTLQRAGIETTNVYTGFLSAAVHMLASAGEMIAITPCRFCNGTYFRKFHTWFLNEMTLRRLHSFISREDTFREDDVRQETIILRAVKATGKGCISITSSTGPADDITSAQLVDYAQVVRPDDPQVFIRILTDDLAQQIAARMATCRMTLADLGLTISTGRVVDFRARDNLRTESEKGTVPLIWQAHFNGGSIEWPKKGARKPEHFLADDAVESQLVPSERGYTKTTRRRRACSPSHAATATASTRSSCVPSRQVASSSSFVVTLTFT